MPRFSKLPASVRLLIFVALLMVSSEGASGNIQALWYVASSGNDANNCMTPTTPCATIQGAINKAAPNDTINVATGSYSGGGTYFVVAIDKSISLRGGWDLSFTTQTEYSTVDGQDIKAGIFVPNSATVFIERFIVRNGTGGIGSSGNLTLQDVKIEDNDCALLPTCWAGLAVYGGNTVVRKSVIQNNRVNSGAAGIMAQFSSSIPQILLEDTLIAHNFSQGGPGAAIDLTSASLVVVNSTIANNTAWGSDGSGGIAILAATVSIYNSTISGNRSSSGGGGINNSSTSPGTVRLSNTILADNRSNNGFDCSGPIQSAGYNLIERTIGCNFVAQPTDKLNQEPLIISLADYGGPTHTVGLFQGSPAVDGGNPAGCKDHGGVVLTTDQRGYNRPVDGNLDGQAVCDIGAFEARASELEPPPGLRWYVSPVGNDGSDCRTPESPCRSLASAVQRMTAGETLYVAVGDYQPVHVDKRINLLGGWNNSFTTQVGRSTLNGGGASSVIRIADQLKVQLDRIVVENGSATRGGGIDIGWMSEVTLTNSVVRNNSATNGGGIGTNNSVLLTIRDSQIVANDATQDGGGLFTGTNAIVSLERVVVADNQAYEGGGLTGGLEGQLILDQSLILRNQSHDSGGGIAASMYAVTVKRSQIIGNTSTAGSGGGVYAWTVVVSDSLIANNQAAEDGGGLACRGGSNRIVRSSVSGNKSQSWGGGLYCYGQLFIENSTFTRNSASHSSYGKGGGIFQVGSDVFHLRNVTIEGNVAGAQGGGIHASIQARMANTLVANNTSPSGPDCYGPVISLGYNLVRTVAGCSFQQSTGDRIGIDPKLGRDFGYPPTLVLEANSPAIDAGNPTGCLDTNNQPLTTDQLGTARPLDGNGDGTSTCDIGAFEYDPQHPPQWTFLPLVTR